MVSRLYPTNMRLAHDIFIENLKRIRTKKGLSQAKLAEEADLSAGLIGDIETGRTNPTLTTIEKIALALHVPVHQLFYDSTEELPDTDLTRQEKIKAKLYGLIDEYLEGGS